MSSVPVSPAVLKSPRSYSAKSSVGILSFSSERSSSKLSFRVKLKERYKNRARRLMAKIWILLGISEVVLIALVITQILTLQSFIYTQLDDIALEQLQMLDLQYRIKLDQMVSQQYHVVDFE